MMKKLIAATALAATLAAVPLSSANAYDHYRGGGHGYGGHDHGWHHGPGPVLGLLGAAVVGTVALATFPFRAAAEPAYVEAPPPPQPYYAPQVVYQQPYYAQPVYYAPPRYYARPRVVYVGPAY